MPIPTIRCSIFKPSSGTVAIAALVLASVTSEAIRAEQRLQVQEAVSRILAESFDLREAAYKIIQVLCSRAGWDLGAVWQVDRTRNEIACVELWQKPSIAAAQFEADDPGTQIRSRNRFAGSSLAQRKTGMDHRYGL